MKEEDKKQLINGINGLAVLWENTQQALAVIEGNQLKSRELIMALNDLANIQPLDVAGVPSGPTNEEHHHHEHGHDHSHDHHHASVADAEMQRVENALEELRGIRARLDVGAPKSSMPAPAPTEQQAQAPVAVPTAEGGMPSAEALMMEDRILHTVRALLSPEIMAGGRGFAKPGELDMKQYKEDVRSFSAGDINGWPSGFYRDSNDSSTQFLLQTQNWYLVVGSKRTEAVYKDVNTAAMVHLPAGERFDLKYLNIDQLNEVLKETQAAVKAVIRQASSKQ